MNDVEREWNERLNFVNIFKIRHLGIWLAPITPMRSEREIRNKKKTFQSSSSAHTQTRNNDQRVAPVAADSPGAGLTRFIALGARTIHNIFLVPAKNEMKSVFPWVIACNYPPVTIHGIHQKPMRPQIYLPRWRVKMCCSKIYYQFYFGFI